MKLAMRHISATKPFEGFVAEVSGHSVRVDAARDLAELDVDLVAITKAGG